MTKKKTIKAAPAASDSITEVASASTQPDPYPIWIETAPSNHQETADAPAVFIKEAEKLFKSYATAKELYFTADGLAFFEISDAKNHAKNLKNKEIVIINN
jgi:hypothetical protein